MISAEQIANIDATIALAVHTYPNCRFIHTELEAVSVEDSDGDFHTFDTQMRTEMTGICEVCSEYRPDSELRVKPGLDDPICQYCDEDESGGNE